MGAQIWKTDSRARFLFYRHDRCDLFIDFIAKRCQHYLRRDGQNTSLL